MCACLLGKLHMHAIRSFVRVQTCPVRCSIVALNEYTGPTSGLSSLGAQLIRFPSEAKWCLPGPSLHVHGSPRLPDSRRSRRPSKPPAAAVSTSTPPVHASCIQSCTHAPPYRCSSLYIKNETATPSHHQPASQTLLLYSNTQGQTTGQPVMASARFVVLKALVLAAALVAVPSVLSDPTPLQDFCVANLNATIKVDGFTCKPPTTVVDDDFFSNATRAQVSAFPGLNTLGLSISHITLPPGELNPPHLHPRGSELVLVLKGEVLVGFISGANRLFSKVVKENELFVVPRGLLHFQFNVGAGDAVFVATFNSQSPGVVVPTFALFATKPPIPMEVLAKTFLMSEDEVAVIKSKFS